MWFWRKKDEAEHWIGKLKKRNPRVRQEAIAMLGRLGDARAIEPLIQRFEDKDAAVQRKAVETITQMGAAAVEPLIQALDEENEAFRGNAIMALGNIADVRAIQPLIDLLREKDVYLQAKVMDALKRIGAPAIEPLNDMLDGIRALVRDNALEVLGSIPDERATVCLINALGNRSSYVREKAAEVLEQEGSRVVPALIDAIENPNLVIATNAVEILGEIGDLRAMEALTNALEHPHSAIRKHAVEALALLDDAHAVELLINKLKDNEIEVRRQAAEALGKIGDIRAVEPLIEAFETAGSYIADNAATALGAIGDLRAVAPLIGVLGERTPAKRECIIVALANIGSSAGQLLANALVCEDPGVRKSLVLILDRIGWTPGNDTEKAWYFITKEQWNALVTLGYPATEGLINTLKHHDVVIRRKAIETLGQIGDVRAIEPLQTLAVLEDPISELATMALNQIYTSIKSVLFGQHALQAPRRSTTLVNFDFSEWTLPMSALERIEIYPETYDFHLVERFITYAVNNIGQQHLKDHVEVHIYGDPEQLHPNLRNSLMNLCKEVR